MRPLSDDICIRHAVPEDIPFLARMIHEACRPPFDHCAYDDLVEGLGVNGVDLLEAILRCGASAWGGVEDAHILEEGGTPVATAFGYVPDPQTPQPLRLSMLPKVTAELGWGTAQAEKFRARCADFFSEDAPSIAFVPQAEFIIEYVAVVPEARGRGLIKILLQSLVARAKADGRTSVGIMVITGNDRALHTYQSLGFKLHSAFFEEFFADSVPGFPGLTRLRLRLKQTDDTAQA